MNKVIQLPRPYHFSKEELEIIQEANELIADLAPWINSTYNEMTRKKNWIKEYQKTAFE
jgi:hypothetical protein